MRAILALVLLAACGGKSAPPAPPPPDPFANDPIAVFADLEERLVSAKLIEIEARVESIGVVDVDLVGEVHVERERVSWIKVDGSFAGGQLGGKWSSIQPVEGDNIDVQQDVWADALVIGATRMGVLHNWVKVVTGEDPDHGHGDVRTWVEADQIAWKGNEPGTRTLTYRILVEGVPSGEGEVTLDDRVLPTRREVIVHFPEGDMRVVEKYSRFDVK